MANVQPYSNRLQSYLTDPNSYTGSPGFQFALDQGTQAINRNNSATRGSGNVLAELMRYGTGLAQQDRGNEIGRLQSALGGEQQYDLGQGQNANQSAGIANQFTLGTQQNDNTRRANDQGYGVNLFRANTDAQQGAGQLASQNWRDAATYDLGLRGARTNQFNARTNRGRAQSEDYYAGDTSRRNWWNQIGG